MDVDITEEEKNLVKNMTWKVDGIALLIRNPPPTSPRGKFGVSTTSL